MVMFIIIREEVTLAHTKMAHMELRIMEVLILTKVTDKFLEEMDRLITPRMDIRISTSRMDMEMVLTR